jgi:hypothetical protein
MVDGEGYEWNTGTKGSSVVGMPDPAGGNMTGRTGSGYARILQVISAITVELGTDTEITNGTAASCNSIIVLSATELTCIPSTHIAGAVKAKITVDGIAATSDDTVYTYRDPMTITSFTTTDASATGLTTGGTDITITGTDLLSLNGEPGEVKFGGSDCIVNTWTNTTITCTTTEHAAGPVDVTVSNGSEEISLSEAFTYVEPSLSLELSHSTLNFTITPGSGIGTSYTVATVETNNTVGYNLSMEANGSNLVCAANSAWTIPSISNNGNLVDDSWGYGLGDFDEAANAGAGAWSPPSTWHKIPTSTGDTLFDSDSPSADSGDLHGVYFGVKVGFNTTACANYTQTLTITVVANVFG